jgi:ArsR family transcriptional regulator
MLNGNGQANLEQLSDLFKLLSDKTRLHILMLLAGGERNVSSLCEALSLPQPTVSHHLGLLRMSSIIANRRSGKQVYYALNGRLEQPAAGTVEVAAGSYAVKITEAN